MWLGGGIQPQVWALGSLAVLIIKLNRTMIVHSWHIPSLYSLETYAASKIDFVQVKHDCKPRLGVAVRHLGRSPLGLLGNDFRGVEPRARLLWLQQMLAQLRLRVLEKLH